jgi:hypothetical protein
MQFQLIILIHTHTHARARDTIHIISSHYAKYVYIYTEYFFQDL